MNFDVNFDDLPMISDSFVKSMNDATASISKWSDLYSKEFQSKWSASYGDLGKAPHSNNLGGVYIPSSVLIQMQYDPMRQVTRYSLHGKYGSSIFILVTDDISKEEFRDVVIDMIKTLPGADSIYGSEQFDILFDGSKNVKLGDMAEKLPGIDTMVNMPCKCGHPPRSLYSTIMHLNDLDHWSREKIADWIDTIPGLMQDFTPTQPDRA